MAWPIGKPADQMLYPVQLAATCEH